MRNLEWFVSGMGVVGTLGIIEKRNREGERIEKMRKNDMDLWIGVVVLR